VVFVDSANLRDGPKLHTRWSYIAWHLAGEAGLEPIAEGKVPASNHFGFALTSATPPAKKVNHEMAPERFS
jgi:hypothetical protein